MTDERLAEIREKCAENLADFEWDRAWETVAELLAEHDANAEAVEGWGLLNEVLPQLMARMKGTESSLNFCGHYWAVTCREFAHNKAIRGNMIGLGLYPLSALQEAVAMLVASQ